MHTLKRIIVILLLLLPLSGLYARETFALVLSGGGARGIAHVPIIEELERRGIVPDYVIGTSMGALVGGFYSAGWTGEELEELLRGSDILKKLMVVNNRTGEMAYISPDSLADDNVITVQFGSNGIGAANGILDDQDINGFLRENLIKVLDIDDFDDLSIPFRAIATDITNGKKIVFDSGSLYTALRSSMSLPVAFAPVRLDESTYAMDGGLVDNLPVDVAKSLGADIILAVDVNDALNKNRKLNPEEFETLTGTISAFSISLNMTNSAPQYEDADWVLVPDVETFSTLDFGKAEEILEAGRRCVYDNIDVFDKLEKKLRGRNNRKIELYRDREPAVVENIEYSGLKGFDKQLSSFIGRSLDEKTTAELESLLARIKQYNGLKDISYEFKNNGIVLQPTYYNYMEGSLSFGATGEFGMEYNGVDSPYFAIVPNLSLAIQYHITKKAIISTALIYHDTLTFQARLSTPILKDTSFYIGTDFDYLDRSLISMPRMNGHLIRNDLAAKINGGVFVNSESGLIAEASIGFEYVHLSKLINPVDSSVIVPYSNHGYSYIAGSLSYDTLNRTNALDDGIKSTMVFSLGAEYIFDKGEVDKKIDFGYSFKSTLEMVMGPGNGIFKGIAGAEIDTIRRNQSLDSAYVSTKTGIPSTDYLYGMIGLRGGIGGSGLFFDIAPFVEAFQGLKENTSMYLNSSKDYIPFSNLEDYTLGVKLGFGVSTGLGTFYADFHFGASDKFRCSLMFGIK